MQTIYNQSLLRGHVVRLRIGSGTKVYLGSAEVAAVCAVKGKIPTPDEYLAIAKDKIDPNAEELYQYLNFDQIPDYENSGVVIPVDSIAKAS